DRTALALADGASVHFADGRNFGRGAGEEGFVGDINVVARQAARFHFITEIRRKRDERVARDAHQRGGDLRLVDTAFLDDEQVLARTFGDESVHVEQQTLVVAMFGGFHVGEDRVGVGAGVFGAAHRYVDMMARV